jgi:hypothetical protein
VAQVIAARNAVIYGEQYARAFAVGGSSFSAPDALSVDGHGNGQGHEGVCWLDLSIAGGSRRSGADGSLRLVLEGPNLTVVTVAGRFET